jgi:hypothetical protein
MLRPSRLVSIAALASVLTPLAFAAHTHLPPSSTWTLNTHESDFGGGPTMKSDVFVMVTDTEKWGKYTDVTVDGDGKTWKTSWSGPENGSPRPVVGMPGGSFSTNAATDASVMKLGDGTTLTCDFSVTPDKKKFIEKCVEKTKDGKQANQTIVYDRTK